MLNRAETCCDQGALRGEKRGEDERSGVCSFSGLFSLYLLTSLGRPARPHSSHIFTISEYLFKYAKY